MKLYKRLSILALIVVFIWLALHYISQPDKVSNAFAEKLFDYPLPHHTSLVEQHQYNGRNWVGGGGSGGEWNVVAYMKLNTSLTKKEIVDYYVAAGNFPYPNSDRLGVQIEIYFEDDRKLTEYKQGQYYVTSNGSHQTVAHLQSSELNGVSSEVIVQMVSGFRYFQID